MNIFLNFNFHSFLTLFCGITKMFIFFLNWKFILHAQIPIYWTFVVAKFLEYSRHSYDIYFSKI